MIPDRGGLMEARIARYRAKGDMRSVEIEYGMPGQPTQTVDLAEQCHTAWQRFLNIHGIATSI
jgi:hypothetical protein